jgi:hypothetical protein
MAEGIIAVILGVLAFFAILVWALHLPKYFDCLKNPKGEQTPCLTDFITLSPPVQEVVALQQACDPNNSSDLKCGLTLAQKVAEEKLSK